MKGSFIIKCENLINDFNSLYGWADVQNISFCQDNEYFVANWMKSNKN